MMKKFAKAMLSVTFGFALIMPFASVAQTPIAKSGTYSAWVGWHSFGTLTDLGKGVMQWHGEFDGALRNDSGSGFLHDTSVVCPGATLIVGDHVYYRGNCIITDKDGDRATLASRRARKTAGWQGRASGPPNGPKGGQAPWRSTSS